MALYNAGVYVCPVKYAIIADVSNSRYIQIDDPMVGARAATASLVSSCEFALESITDRCLSAFDRLGCTVIMDFWKRRRKKARLWMLYLTRFVFR